MAVGNITLSVLEWWRKVRGKVPAANLERFDEHWYLSNYPDVAKAVKAGKIRTGREHYIRHGHREGRDGCEADFLVPLPDVDDLFDDEISGIELDPEPEVPDLQPVFDPKRSAALGTCFVHGGGHKTGSSALQSFLLQNREALIAKGYYVPVAGRSGAHHGLMRRIAGMPVREWQRTNIEQLAQEVLNGDCKHMIISSEMIETLIMFGSDFSKFFGFLRHLGFQIVFVYYARHTPQLLNSQYSQLAKTYRMTTPFDRYIGNTLENRSNPLTKILDALDKDKIERIIRPYNERVRHLGIVKDFFESIGLSDFEAGKQVARTNESIGPVAVEVARRSMMHIPGGVTGLTQLQTVQCARALRDALDKAELTEPSYCGLTTGLAKRIEQAFQAENDVFAQRAWGKSWNEVFAEDVGRDYAPNDLAQVTPMLQQLDTLAELLGAVRPQIDRILSNRNLKRRAGFNQARATQIGKYVKKSEVITLSDVQAGSHTHFKNTTNKNK
jgi:hypothetical protein